MSNPKPGAIVKSQPTKETQREIDRQKTTSELETLCRECILAFNDHDFDLDASDLRREFHSRIAPKFQSRIENYPDQPLNWAEMTELWRGFATAEPDCRFTIRNLATDINPNGTAVVFMEIDVAGMMMKNLSFVRVMEMRWRVIQGRWMYYNCTAIGGQSPDG